MTAIFTLGHNARNCATAKIPHHDILCFFLSFFFPPCNFFVKPVQIPRKGKFELLVMQFIKGDSFSVCDFFFPLQIELKMLKSDYFSFQTTRFAKSSEENRSNTNRIFKEKRIYRNRISRVSRKQSFNSEVDMFDMKNRDIINLLSV